MKFLLFLMVFVTGFTHFVQSMSVDETDLDKKPQKKTLYFPPATVVDAFLKAIPVNSCHEESIPAFSYYGTTWKLGAFETYNHLLDVQQSMLSPNFQKMCIFSNPLKLECWYEQSLKHHTHWFYITPAGEIDLSREEKKSTTEYFFFTQTKDPMTFLVQSDVRFLNKMQY